MKQMSAEDMGCQSRAVAHLEMKLLRHLQKSVNFDSTVGASAWCSSQIATWEAGIPWGVVGDGSCQRPAWAAVVTAQGPSIEV